MAARKDKSNTAGQFKPNDERTRECASKGAAEKLRKLNEEIKPLRAIGVETCLTEENMQKWIVQLLKLWEEKNDLQAFKLLLQILGIMPKTEQTIDLKVEGLSDEDRELIETVRARYEAK